MDARSTRILLASDGSKDASLAARAAADVCEVTGAELHVVHAWHSVPTVRLRPFMSAELKKLGKELLEEGVKRVEDLSAARTSSREGLQMRYWISPGRSGRGLWG